MASLLSNASLLSGSNTVYLTREEYNGLAVKDPAVRYLIRPSGADPQSGRQPFIVESLDGSVSKWKHLSLLPFGELAAGTSDYVNGVSSSFWIPEKSLFVGYGTWGIHSSTDGINWTLRYQSNFFVGGRGVYAPELGLIATVSQLTSSNANVLTSPDGITWTTRLNAAIYFSEICWSPDLLMFVAVASSVTTGNKVVTSSDGITWTRRASANDTLSWQNVFWHPLRSRFMAFTSDGDVMESSNGTSWSLNAAKVESTTSYYVPELNVIIGQIGRTYMTSSANLVVSFDGINWINVFLPFGCSALPYIRPLWDSDDQLIYMVVALDATSTLGLAVSPDAINWKLKAWYNIGLTGNFAMSRQLNRLCFFANILPFFASLS